jgi:hypothetical protein
MPCIFPVCSVKNCCYLHRAMMAVYCNAIHLVRRLVHPSRCSADKKPTISPKLRHMRMPKRTCMPKRDILIHMCCAHVYPQRCLDKKNNNKKVNRVHGKRFGVKRRAWEGVPQIISHFLPAL